MLALDIDMNVPRIRCKLKASVSATRKGGCGVYVCHAESIWADCMVLGSISLRLE